MIRRELGSVPLVVVGLALCVGLGCDVECIDGPSNLTPEATAACVVPEGASEDQIKSAGAWTEDGNLVLTFSAVGLGCGEHARDYQPPFDCDLDGWVLSVELPPELAVAGVIDLAEHPELDGALTAFADGDGLSSSSELQDSFFVGEIELVEVGEACVSGVLRGFGTGSLDPRLGGPELDGSFVAPRC